MITSQEQLHELYITQNISMRNIAKTLNTNYNRVRKLLKNYNIKFKTKSEAGKNKHNNNGEHNPMHGVHRFGKKNPNYKHGETCKIDKFCLDCGKKLNSHFAIKCRKCVRKGIKNPKLSAKIKGRNNHRFGKPAHHGKRIYYKDICFRSRLEVMYAKYLDSTGIEWKYECKTFDLGDYTYTPDFYLIDTDEYIEIKGFWRILDKIKFDLLQKLYADIKIQVLMLKDLNKLGLYYKEKICPV